MTVTSLWHNFSDNVVTNNDWSCLLISGAEVHWRVRLLPDGAAESTKCMGLCAHCTCLSTMPPWELSAMIENEQRPPSNSPNLNALEISCLGSDARRYFETFIGCQKQFLNKKSHWRRCGTIFPQVHLTKLSRVLEIVW